MVNRAAVVQQQEVDRSQVLCGEPISSAPHADLSHALGPGPLVDRARDVRRGGVDVDGGDASLASEIAHALRHAQGGVPDIATKLDNPIGRPQGFLEKHLFLIALHFQPAALDRKLLDCLNHGIDIARRRLFLHPLQQVHLLPGVGDQGCEGHGEAHLRRVQHVLLLSQWVLHPFGKCEFPPLHFLLQAPGVRRVPDCLVDSLDRTREGPVIEF
mmetsp:Transcript_143480/g.357559  ORF Transcript_143480/g.357559 Transcript_143480/m.357559 type:complete len:214 (-) Transcript_143480:1373-2014(-)